MKEGTSECEVEEKRRSSFRSHLEFLLAFIFHSSVPSLVEKITFELIVGDLGGWKKERRE